MPRCRFRTFVLPILVVFLCGLNIGGVSGKAPTKYYQLTAEETVTYARSLKGRKAIFIYASWCPHCVKALPHLMAIEKAHPGSIVAVSTDKDPKALYRYLKKYPEVPFHVIVLKGNKSIEKTLGVPSRRGVPHYILMNGQGKAVRSSNMRTQDVKNFVNGG